MSDLTDVLVDKRSKHSQQIRRATHKLKINNLRQKFIKTHLSTQPSLSFEQIKQQINNSYKQLFNLQTHVFILEQLLCYEQMAIHNNVHKYIISLLEKCNQEIITTKVYDILLKFVQDGDNIQSFAIINAIKIAKMRKQFMLIWVYLSSVNELQIKQFALKSFEQLVKDLQIEKMQGQELQFFISTLQNFMFRSNIQAYQCYFTLDIILKILETKSPIIFSKAVLCIDIFTKTKTDIKVLLSKKIISILCNQMKNRSDEKEIQAFIRIIGKIFEHDSEFINIVFTDINIIDIIISKLNSTQNYNIKKFCFIAISNLIAQNQSPLIDLMNRNFFEYISKLFYESNEIIQKQIISILHVIIFSTSNISVLFRLLNNNIFQILSYSIPRISHGEIKEKCLASTFELLSLIQNCGINLSQQQKNNINHKIEASNLQSSIEQYLNQQTSKKGEQLSNRILQTFFNKF